MSRLKWIVGALLLASLPMMTAAGPTYGPTSGGGSSYAPMLTLPDTIGAVVGAQANLWYDQLSPVMPGLDGSAFLCASDSGKTWARSWRWTPAAARNTALTIKALDANGTIQSTASTVVAAVAKTAGVGYKNVLFIGDSQGVSSSYLLTSAIDSLFLADGGSAIRLLGTRGTGRNLSEFRGGWEAKHWADSTGTVKDNPFYINGRLDFRKWTIAHLDSSGYHNNNDTEKPGYIDYFVISLGGNDLFSSVGAHDMTAAEQTLILGYYDSIIAGALNGTYGYSNARVYIELMQQPANHIEASGYGYAALGTTYSTVWPYYVRNVAKLNKAILDRYDGRRYNARVDVIGAGLNVDRVFGYPRIASAANSRTSGTETLYTNLLHCGPVGLYELADGTYAHLRQQMSLETNYNAVLKSEDFKTQWSVVPAIGEWTEEATTTAPDGSSGAQVWETKASTTSAFYKAASADIIIGTDNVFSCFLKYSEDAAKISMRVDPTAGTSMSIILTLDSATGTTYVSRSGLAVGAWGSSAYPNGWQRVFITFPGGADVGKQAALYIYPASDTSLPARTVGLWGAQFETGTTIPRGYMSKP